MPEVDGTCEYELDPEQPETWGGDECYVREEVLNEDGVWTCPHDAEEGDDLCIFHLPVEEKDNGTVITEFLDVLDEAAASDDPATQERKLQFLAAQFGTFDLSENPPKVWVEGAGIEMAHAKIDGKLDWSNTEFGGDVSFRSVEFVGDANFHHTEFGGDVNFYRAKFERNADFRFAEFRRDVDFHRAEFGGYASFLGVRFGKDADFRFMEFGGEVTFPGAEFEAHVNFRDTEFGRGANFAGAEFNEGANFDDLILHKGRFDRANLTDAIFTDATLHDIDLESALLSRASLLGTDLRGAKLSGATLGDVRIDDDTQFLGHPSDDSDTSPHTFSSIRSQPCCVYDPDYEEDNEHADVDKAKSVYRALEELAGKAARPRLQSRCFVRRQDLQKDEYKQDAKEADSLEKRLIAGARWSRARTAESVLLYGESPWRIISWSLAIVFGFALLYPFGGWMRPEGGAPITYSQIAANPIEFANSVYYSTLTFTALGFGDFRPVGFGRALTTIETGLGAVLVALLVFVLGRRAAR